MDIVRRLIDTIKSEHFTGEKEIFSKAEETYIREVILSAMENAAKNEESTLQNLLETHKTFTADKKGQNAIKNIDTFGLVCTAMDSIKELQSTNMDYREEILDHGKEFMFNQMKIQKRVRNRFSELAKQN